MNEKQIIEKVWSMPFKGKDNAEGIDNMLKETIKLCSEAQREEWANKDSLELKAEKSACESQRKIIRRQEREIEELKDKFKINKHKNPVCDICFGTDSLVNYICEKCENNIVQKEIRLWKQREEQTIKVCEDKDFQLKAMTESIDKLIKHYEEMEQCADDIRIGEVVWKIKELRQTLTHQGKVGQGTSGGKA